MKFSSIAAFAFVSIAVVVFKVFSIAPAAEPKEDPRRLSADHDEWIFEAKRREHDTASLVAYLQKLSARETDLIRIDTLIERLADKRFSVRAESAMALSHLGRLALPHLQKSEVLNSRDAEVAAQAAKCIKDIRASQQMREEPTMLPLAAVRLIVKRGVPEALQTLLQYLPFANDPEIEEELYYSLDSIAVKDGKILPALIKALGDRLAVRRAVAGCIVARDGTSEERRAASKLLTDPDPYVRLRTAQGCLARLDLDGIPTLIGLLEEKNAAIAWQAEELLRWYAAGEGPEKFVMDGENGATEAAKCWRNWWELSSSRRPSSKRKNVKPCLYFFGRKGVLCGSDGSKRWQFAPPAKGVELVGLNHDGNMIGYIREKNPPGVKYPRDPWRLQWYSLAGSLLQDVELDNCVRPTTVFELPNGHVIVLDRLIYRRVNLTSPASLRDSANEIKEASSSPALSVRAGLLIRVVKGGASRRQTTGVIYSDPTTGESLRQLSVAPLGEGMKDCGIIGLAGRLAIAKDNNLVLDDLFLQSRSNLAIQAPESLSEEKIPTFAIQHRDGRIMLLCGGDIAEIDFKKGLLWQMKCRYGSIDRVPAGDVSNCRPYLALLRFGFSK